MRIVIIVSAAFLSGCMAHYEKQLAGATSASIGCPAEEIALKDRKYQFTHQTWVAECRGIKYFCRQSTNDPASLSCAKEAK